MPIRDQMKPKILRPLIVGHRGASALAPENTLAAFQRAVNDGADGIEFDVRLAKDGEAVVFHDQTLNRTTPLSAKISDLTSGELSAVDAGSWFRRMAGDRNGNGFSKETVPTLSRTLGFLQDFTGVIYIELKCDERDHIKLTEAVCRTIRNSNISSKIVVKSFRLAVIPHVKLLAPEVTTAALFAPKIMTILRKEKHLVRLAAEFGADELSIHYSLATRKLMQKAEKHGLPVAIWTADNPRWVKRALKLGLKAIITNDPGRLLARRKDILGCS